jgi:nitrogen fixation protein NifU and related proteins
LTSDRLIHHHKNPVGIGIPEGATHEVHHRNHSCGDDITLGWIVENGIITHIGVEIHGCMMHKASASILCSKVLGMRMEDVPALVAFVTALSDGTAPMPDTQDIDFLALADIRNYPTRRNCVMLSWEALGTGA